MEKTNKMKSLTNDMKTFEKLMQKQRKEKQIPEIELEIDTEEDSPADILLQAAGMLMDCSVMVAKAAFLVGLMEADCSVMVAKAAFLVGLMEAETDEDDEDECENCPYSGDCGSTYGTMVLVARPDGDNAIMTMDELAEEIGDIFAGQTGTYDMHPIPGTEDLYYTIAEKKPLKRGNKTYYKTPAVIFGIDEEAGEVVSPNARQLYAAARYFEEHSTTIRTREGSAPVFCFD